MQPYRVGSPAQIREIDRIAMDEYGLPGLALMENAGRGAARMALEMLARPDRSLVVILCGKGNNGGDGFVVARWLRNAGVDVRAFLTAAVGDVPRESDAGVNLGVALRMGVPVAEILDADGVEQVTSLLPKADLIVDALLGTGLSGAVREPALTLIRVINDSGKPVLAVDIPSGLCSNTGQALGAAVKADTTVTFAAAKTGFFEARGPEYVGRLVLVDIGVPKELIRTET